MSTPFNIKLGPSGELLNVAENEFIFKELEKSSPLNPRQLLSMAARYRNLPLMVPLADKLTSSAISQIIHNTNVKNAIEKIKNESMDWSIFDDIWKAIVYAVTGFIDDVAAGKKGEANPNPFDEYDSAGCKYYCLFFFLLIEDCKTTGKRVSGVCFGGST